VAISYLKALRDDVSSGTQRHQYTLLAKPAFQFFLCWFGRAEC
jgi:hypothetical protein